MSDVSRETTEKLTAYTDLLLTWNKRINLIGKADLDSVMRRHIDDCVQVAGLVGSESRVVDLGSGAGLPGLIVSICRPDIRVECVESDQRKCAFLREAIRALSLNAKAYSSRIEALPSLLAPVVTARGLAPLSQLLEYVSHHLGEGGIALLMKGQNWQEELEMATSKWHISYEAVPSKTHPQAVILSIRGLRRA